MNEYIQRTNAERDIQALADGYKTKIEHSNWLLDGLQKDAIQNSWDARDNKKGHNWGCSFTVKKLRGKNYLLIEDSGTKGLEGTKFSNDQELSEILLSNRRNEDLAYFLNSNWSAKALDEGGNRGRGKTLFLAASEDRTIIFDSMRKSDGAYVLGKIWLDNDKQIKFKIFYDDDAKKALQAKWQAEITPKKESGTRIFIEEPKESIVEGVTNGEVISFISTAFWEIIKKYDANISVGTLSGVKSAQAPDIYLDELGDVNTKIFNAEQIKDGSEFKTKKLILRYSNEIEVPESLKGIAIQRGGMTIQRLRADNLVHEEGTSNIFGWIELDKELENSLKENCEGPEHFDFSWVNNPAKNVKDYLRLKVREYAKDIKIIGSEQSKISKVQKDAEEKALYRLASIYKKLSLLGKGVGKNTKKRHKRKENEPLRLSSIELQFPRESKRIEYGEKIVKPRVIPINDFKEPVYVNIKVYVASDEYSETLEEKELYINPSENEPIGWDELIVNKKMKPGEYSFKARMTSLEERPELKLPDGTAIEKGTRLYERVNHRFYVEIDPPKGKGPLRFQAEPRDDKGYLFDWEAEEGGHVIYYNTTHPRLEKIKSDSNELTKYLTEQALFLLLQIKLEEETAEEITDGIFNLGVNKDISDIYRIMLNKYSELLWEVGDDGN
ncbi:MAG: hypothetical protein PHW75_01560 [Patescibacteria group bacterium]|nr:hypothetical protein [Patescibacteria group bacterium]